MEQRRTRNKSDGFTKRTAPVFDCDSAPKDMSLSPSHEEMNSIAATAGGASVEEASFLTKKKCCKTRMTRPGGQRVGFA